MFDALILTPWMAPHQIVPWYESICLSFTNKVDVLEAYSETVRSPSVTVCIPAVARLKNALGRTKKDVKFSRANVYARDGHRCQYCGAQAENIDHIVPRSKGGLHTWDNVVAACRRCNARKRDHLLEETGMKLRHPPLAPRGRVWALAALGAVLPDWEPYLGLPAQVVPLTVLEEGAAALSA